MKTKVGKTNRGFSIITFRDHYDHPCSLQKSSLATKDAIWFGVDNADPKILASETKEGGTGWVKFPFPDGVQFTTRMHLTREQVTSLLPHLKKFAKTGEI